MTRESLLYLVSTPVLDSPADDNSRALLDNPLSVQPTKARTMSNYRFEHTDLYERYHVSLGAKRTTISIDKTLSNLMSLHLGAQPNTPAARLAVRDWLQARLDKNGDPRQGRVSQWLQGKIAEALISPSLRQKYDEWCDCEWIKQYPLPANNLTERDRPM